MNYSKTRTLIWIAIILTSTAANIGHSEEPTGAEYKQVMLALAGEWSLDAGIATGTLTCELGSAGQCLVSSVAVPGMISADIFEGYDAELKAWKKIYFWSHGGTTTLVLKLKSQEKELPRTLEGTARDVDASGNANSTNVKYTMHGKDRWEVNRADGTTLVFKRLPSSK
jgi:hypothetical protein